MKTGLTALFAIVTSLAAAQPCVETLVGLDHTIPASWISAASYPDGGAVSIVGNNIAQRGAMVTRIGPDNAVQWTRVIIPSNPSIYLDPRTIVAMPDGGAAFFGRITNLAGGLQPFGIRVSSAGEVMWARYYMYRTQGSGAVLNGWQAAPLSNGEVLVAVRRLDGVSLARLDADGVPTWTQRYVVPGVGAPMSLEVDVDGGGLVSFMLFPSTYAFRSDATGNMVWSRSFPNMLPSGQRMLANGDVLFTSYGPARAMRLDPNGDLLWARQYSSGCLGTVEELSNGDLMLASCGLGLRTNASGTPLQAWQTPGGSCGFPRMIVLLVTPFCWPRS